MALDPVTLSAVNRLRPPVGSLVRVSAIADASMLATGDTFNAADYPALAAAIPSSFQADFFDEIAIPSDFDAVSRSSRDEMGYLACIYPTGTEAYFIFISSLYYTVNNPAPDGFAITLYRSKAGRSDLSQGIEFVRRVPLPDFQAAAIPTLIGSNLYLSGYGQVINRRYDLNDLTFQTVKALGNTSFQGARFCEGAGKILAVPFSGGGTQTSSDDGTTFSTLTTGLSGNVQCFAYGAGLFVAISSSTTGTNMGRSTDGVTWTNQLVGAIGHNVVIWNPGASRFVVTPSNTGAYYTSTDGITFSASTSLGSGASRITPTTSGGIMITNSDSTSTGTLNSQMNTGSTAVGVTNRYTASPFAAYAGNPVNGLIVGSAYDNFMIAIAGSNSANYQRMNFLYSTNSGSTWSAPIPIVGGGLPMRFMPPVISTDKSTIVLLEAMETRSSANGANNSTIRANGAVCVNGTWTKFKIDTTTAVNWKTVVANPKQAKGFIAVGSIMTAGLIVATSTDGLNWTVVTSGGTAVTSPIFAGVYPTGELVVLSSATAVIAVSTNNGATFSTRTAIVGTVGGLFKDRLIVMSATVGRYTLDLLTVSNITWTPVTTQTPAGFAADNSKAIVTCANSTTFYYSFDGIAWFTGTLPFAMIGTNPTIVGGWVMLATGGGMVYRSKDFINWELAAVGEDTKYVGDMFNAFSASPDASVALSITQAKQINYFLKSRAENVNVRRIPKVQADVANTFWAVIAK